MKAKCEQLRTRVEAAERKREEAEQLLSQERQGRRDVEESRQRNSRDIAVETVLLSCSVIPNVGFVQHRNELSCHRGKPAGPKTGRRLQLLDNKGERKEPHIDREENRGVGGEGGVPQTAGRDQESKWYVAFSVIITRVRLFPRHEKTADEPSESLRCRHGGGEQNRERA